MDTGHLPAKLQQAFIEDVGPLFACLPEQVDHIAKHIRVPAASVRDFMRGDILLNDIDFSRLSDYLHATYQYGDESLEDNQHRFKIEGDFTFFPRSKAQFVDLYDRLTWYGSDALAFEIVHEALFAHPHYRFLFVDRYGLFFLIVISDNQLFDELLSTNALKNIDGVRIASDQLYFQLREHAEAIGAEPHQRRELDTDFFADMELAFSQLALCKPDIVKIKGSEN